VNAHRDDRPDPALPPPEAADDPATPARVERAQPLGRARKLVILHAGRE